MKLFIVLTTDQVTVNRIRGLLGNDLSKKAYRADSLGENGFCVAIVVPDDKADEVAKKLVEGGVKPVYVFSGIEIAE
jgi:NADH/NAD ratio-sensing transcriptional regulator Rex